MFCVIGSEAAVGFAASVEDALRIGVAGDIAAPGAASLPATACDEDAAEGAESSAPQPLNAKVASATKAENRAATRASLVRPLSLLMFCIQFVKADAVSNPFKK
ncbi:hypothetical protein P0D71_15620 [Paraburkholderia sp. RL17-383-BIF-A]|jgi:hypothetical protein|uniref:hypothetical protein n=1 Tax=Paraburkholderia TaxID=1822464 RepID=UPI0038B9CB8F